jgi:hypothetical protein
MIYYKVLQTFKFINLLLGTPFNQNNHHNNEILRLRKPSRPLRQRLTTLRYGAEGVQTEAIEWVNRVGGVNIQPLATAKVGEGSLQFFV